MSPKPNLRSAPSLTTCSRQLTSETNRFTCSQRWMGRHSVHLEVIRQVPPMSLAAPSQLPEPLGQSIVLVKIWLGVENSCRLETFTVRNAKCANPSSGFWVLCLSRYPFSAVIMTMSCAGFTQGEQQLSQTVRGRKKPSWSAAPHTCCGVLVVIDGARK